MDQSPSNFWRYAKGLKKHAIVLSLHRTRFSLGLIRLSILELMAEAEEGELSGCFSAVSSLRVSSTEFSLSVRSLTVSCSDLLVFCSVFNISWRVSQFWQCSSEDEEPFFFLIIAIPWWYSLTVSSQCFTSSSWNLYNNDNLDVSAPLPPNT